MVTINEGEHSLLTIDERAKAHLLVGRVQRDAAAVDCDLVGRLHVARAVVAVRALEGVHNHIAKVGDTVAAIQEKDEMTNE